MAWWQLHLSRHHSTGGSGCVEAFLGHGGFGGGGGGCTAGGGGGGFSGGRAWSDKGRNGEGGYSFIGSNGTLGHVVKGANLGDGKVIVIPAVVGCGCTYRCVALDAHRSTTMCICPNGWVLHSNRTSCIMLTPPELDTDHTLFNSPQTIVLGIIVIFMAVIIGAGSFSLYKVVSRQLAATEQLNVRLTQLQHQHTAVEQSLDTHSLKLAQLATLVQDNNPSDIVS
ncbi:hypothetical protein J6590_033909 [Homalodisca vitripennis]|nr:hypothetical protein J6590_033909 [Homalodisca vitripennis]